jgi:uncharacterized protein YcaQ
VVDELSVEEARRVVLAGQGFGARSAKATMGQVRKVASRIHYFQIDSINVLARAHYIPAFSRLGPYSMSAIDTLAYKRRELFEVWGKAACLTPIDLYPLLLHRKLAVRRTGITWEPGGSRPDSAYIEKAYNEVAERGPLVARELSEPGKRRGKWWGWGAGKIALEYLWRSGMVEVAGRRGFERLYDIAERVIPQEVLDAEPPETEEAKKQLICLASKAQGVAGFRELVGYFGIDGWFDLTRENDGKRWKPVGRRLVAELVEEKLLIPVKIARWKELMYMAPRTRVPSSIEARALIGPFDTLMWGSMPRLSGFERRLAQELYVPAEKRMYGYYVLPFLLGESLVARCDLKADRQRRVLMVQSAFLEKGQDGKRVAAELADELRDMQTWLEMDSIEVASRGNLSAKLKRTLR